jgi:hypothetical protein
VLGHAFKSTKSNKTRKELLIFIQPVVVSEDDDSLTASQAENHRTIIGADAEQVFPEVPLPSYEKPMVPVPPPPPVAVPPPQPVVKPPPPAVKPLVRTSGKTTTKAKRP